MANQKTTMSEESKDDVVKEARELLMGVTPWPWFDFDAGAWLQEPKRLLSNFADSVVIARSPELLSALCDEVEELRRRNTTQEQSITHLQAQQRVMKEAIEAARTWIYRVSNQYILAADDPHEVLVQLRSAITPKGSEQ